MYTNNNHKLSHVIIYDSRCSLYHSVKFLVQMECMLILSSPPAFDNGKSILNHVLQF